MKKKLFTSLVAAAVVSMTSTSSFAYDTNPPFKLSKLKKVGSSYELLQRY